MNGLVQPDHRADTLQRYRLINTTTYHFDDAQASCELDIRLVPRSDHYQLCEHHGLIVRPLPSVWAERLDRHHNALTRVTLGGELRRLTLSAVSEVSMTMRERGPRWSQLTEPWSHCIVAWSEAVPPEVLPPEVLKDAVFQDFVSSQL